jgi:hypothetical protein
LVTDDLQGEEQVQEFVEIIIQEELKSQLNYKDCQNPFFSLFHLILEQFFTHFCGELFWPAFLHKY